MKWISWAMWIFVISICAYWTWQDNWSEPARACIAAGGDKYYGHSGNCTKFVQVQIK